MMSSFDVDAAWYENWNREVAEQEERTGKTRGEWRSAGRSTKDKPNGEDAMFWAAEGGRQAREYALWLDLHPEVQIATTAAGDPMVEIAVSGQIGDVHIKGYADAVFAMPMLVQVDFKSGSRNPAGPQQLALYSVLMRKLDMPTPEYGAFFSTRKAMMGPLEPLAQWDEAWWIKQFSRLVAGKEHDIYIPNIGDHCRGCGVRSFCYAVGGSEAHLFDPDHPNFSISNSNMTETETV
jgi:hypothetical protein